MRWLGLLLLSSISISCRSGVQPDRRADLDQVIATQHGLRQAQKHAVSSNAAIAGTSEPLALRAGIETIRAGGTAPDAALTTALTQIALTAGSAVTYAGILTAAYYDASSGRIHALNAGYNTVRDETDLLTIPKPGVPSGRSALVPGFMAGVEALHKSFGKLPFKSLFDAPSGSRIMVYR